jgi:hypothetical protein
MSRRRQVNEDRRQNGEKVDEDRKLVVWTSARRRAYHTAWPFVRLEYRVEEKPQMGEINVSLSRSGKPARFLLLTPIRARLTARSVGRIVVGRGAHPLPGRVGALPQGPVCPPSTQGRELPRSECPTRTRTSSSISAQLSSDSLKWLCILAAGHL